MKRKCLPLCLLCVCGLMLCGCVLSLNGLGTPEQAVFKPELVGKWVDDGPDSGNWTFEKDKDNEKAYVLTILGKEAKEGKSVFHVLLFEIEGKLFLDMFPHEVMLEEKEPKTRGDLYNWCLIEGHMIARVQSMDPKLQMCFLGPDMLDKVKPQDKQGIDVQKIRDRTIITPPTDKLRAFLGRIAKDDGLWSGGSDMERAK